MKKSAGILLYKKDNEKLKYLIVHPGGVYFENNNKNTWSIPKGEFTEEKPLEAAIREFKEETSIDMDFNKKCLILTPITQKSGKVVYAFAFEGDIDTKSIKSNLFEMEYPKGSGKIQSFPEIDKAEWVTKEQAELLLIKSQFNFILELEQLY